MSESKSGVTPILQRIKNGDSGAQEELLRAVYEELRRLARAAMNGERPDHTLQPTALVHEAFLHLTGGAPIDWQDRVHFFSVAARTMRRVLIDHARNAHSQKRWGGQRVELDEQLRPTTQKAESSQALESALERLEKIHPRKCRVVELRFFGGLSIVEVAAVLKLAPRTVERDWEFARAWLHAAISPDT